MSDNKTTPSDLDLLIARIDDLAREIGEMDPNDPLCAMRVKELYTLTQLSKSLQTDGTPKTPSLVEKLKFAKAVF